MDIQDQLMMARLSNTASLTISVAAEHLDKAYERIVELEAENQRLRDELGICHHTINRFATSIEQIVFTAGGRQ